MHEISLGGTIADYLTGETRQNSTYEDLRQALARFLVEERSYPAQNLQPRYSVSYTTKGEIYSREADLALFAENDLLLLFLFCPGQIHTYTRELTALARLCLPAACPLAVVTDMREAELFAVADGQILAKGLRALPDIKELCTLAKLHPVKQITEVQREAESKILHAYTGLLKNCCTECITL